MEWDVGEKEVKGAMKILLRDKYNTFTGDLFLHYHKKRWDFRLKPIYSCLYLRTKHFHAILTGPAIHLPINWLSYKAEDVGQSHYIEVAQGGVSSRAKHN